MEKDKVSDGSPHSLAEFVRDCHDATADAISRLVMPDLLFAGGDHFREIATEPWCPVAGRNPLTLMGRLLVEHVAATGASRVGITVACGGEQPSVVLIVANGEDVVAEQARLERTGELRLDAWRPYPVPEVPELLRSLLAANAPARLRHVRRDYPRHHRGGR